MGRGAPCFPAVGLGIGLPVPVVVPDVGIVGSLPVPGSVSLASRPASFSDSFRTTPNFMILGFTAANGIVQSIRLDEVAAFGVSMVRIVLINPQGLLSRVGVAKEQTSFQVTMGYDNPGQSPHGTFIVQRPKFRFPAGEADTTVEIVGYSEAVKLGATERRQAYKKMSDADIARMIAGRNGLAADVGTTSPVYDQVIQANESDWKFLERRAKLYGFMLYVENGILHFHKVRPRESGISVTGGDTPGALQDLTVQSRTFMRGAQLTMTQMDPITKQEILAMSTEAPDAVQSRLDFKNWAEMVTIPGVGQPKRYVVGEGHKQSQPELMKMVDEMAKSTRYVVSGSGLLHGIETIRANDLITINGVGRSSGKYYVTRAVHELDAGEGELGGSYRVRFEVVRSGAGQTVDAGGSTVQPQSAGSVAL
jgi:phage protein D